MEDVECRCATARNIFSNIVDITIAGEEPPSEDTEEHKDLMKESQQTSFDITLLD